MKLVTYLYQDKESVGVLTADEATVRPLPFADMNTLIEAPREQLLSAQQILERRGCIEGRIHRFLLAARK